MNIFTIGNGFLANHLNYQKINSRLEPSSRLIDQILDVHKPDVLINCIGYTGRPNIDACEANKEQTSITNTVLPILLAEACAKKSIHFINIGSGCIYFGRSPNIKCDCNYSCDCSYVENKWSIDTGWKETDFANPKSYYSKSKWAADLSLGDMAGTTTLRIRMPISEQDNQRNFINKIRGYKQIIDIPNSMTFMDDLVRCVDWAIKGTHTGIFHVVNPEPITAAQVMREFQKYVPDHKFEVISEDQLDNLTIAKRSNCILDSSKLKNAGFNMSNSVPALEKCMKNYIKNYKL
jgi:dTDP-4-dehydrorhamnose reductase